MCLLNCLRSKNTLKLGKIFEFLKLTAEPKVLENLKRSWKKSWKVMEFEELKRVQTLQNPIANLAKILAGKQKVWWPNLGVILA